jgi:sulfate adenylyltransferase
MESTKRKNKEVRNCLFIDKEALSVLALAQNGLLSPVDKLMNSKESEATNKTKIYKNITFPFAFVLAPSGRRNAIVMQKAKVGEVLDLIVDGQKEGELVVDEVFPINRDERIRNIYGTNDYSHPGVNDIFKRLGELAISGAFKVNDEKIRTTIDKIKNLKKILNAQKTTALMIGANPFHKGHEELIRTSLENTDLLILFLLKPYNRENDKSNLSYKIRYKTVEHFINNFLPKNKVVLVEFENSYIFAGFNEIILDAIVAKNYGCDTMIIGENHAGVGVYYDQNRYKSIVDYLQNINVDIKIIPDFVYCSQCGGAIRKDICPHGQHNHIIYDSKIILELYFNGLIPPPVVVRPEISSIVMADLFPNRFKSIENIYDKMIPNNGLLEKHNEIDFYLSFLKLYSI